jgi:hypothetical protein
MRFKSCAPIRLSSDEAGFASAAEAALPLGGGGGGDGGGGAVGPAFPLGTGALAAKSGWAARNPSTAASRDAMRADNSAICCRRSSSGAIATTLEHFPGCWGVGAGQISGVLPYVTKV